MTTGYLDMASIAPVIVRTVASGTVRVRQFRRTGAFNSYMGEVVRLSEVRAARERSTTRIRPPKAEFFFDLSCPFSYLAAERVDRAFDAVTWTPACATALRRGLPGEAEVEVRLAREAAERRAQELRIPLVWPDSFPEPMTAAMRAAAYAADCGRGGAFALAAARLAYCGGFHLEDPEALAEAAAAAGISLQGCLEAAGDPGRDGRIETAGRRLLAAGADRLPALRVGRTLVWSERKVSEAATTALALAAGRV